MARSGRRPLTRAATLGLAGHAFLELAAGVGMPFASVLGPGRAAAVWAAGGGALWTVARQAGPRADAGLTAANAVGLAAVTAHLRAWPCRSVQVGRARVGLPWLVDCEALGPGLMPYYNAILHWSGATALAALAWENRKSRRALPAALAGAGLLVPALVALQHLEFHRLRAIARETPAWWNRRLAVPPAD